MFPDDWQLGGKLIDQYRQVGNAVPVGLGEAVGRAILAHMAGDEIQPPAGFPFSRYKGTDELSWERNTRKALGLFPDQSKPEKPEKKQRKPQEVPVSQLALFETEGHH